MDANILWLMVAGAILAFPLGCWVGHKFAMYYMVRINEQWRFTVARVSEQLSGCQQDREDLAKRLKEAEEALDMLRMESR